VRKTHSPRGTNVPKVERVTFESEDEMYRVAQKSKPLPNDQKLY